MAVYNEYAIREYDHAMHTWPEPTQVDCHSLQQARRLLREEKRAGRTAALWCRVPGHAWEIIETVHGVQGRGRGV
jgi:hypothetical protein